ncbi:hypothetical protein INR49_027930 [Caranx melampygus]|nr:hypothetical protein INR49_027930 [Caranx melampygus]
MSADVEARRQVADFQTRCDRFLSITVHRETEGDEQQRNKEDMAKINFHGRPPALVEQGKEPTWAEAKSQLGGRQQQRRMKG